MAISYHFQQLRYEDIPLFSRQGIKNYAAMHLAAETPEIKATASVGGTADFTIPYSKHCCFGKLEC